MKILITLLAGIYIFTLVAALTGIIILMPLLVFNTWVAWDGYSLSIILR